jgi:hypothetical protein
MEPPPREIRLAPQPVAPPVTVGYPGMEIRVESDFYEPLTPYGRWEVVGAYGRCWVPGRVEADWRPYCNGYWQRTEAGWYWTSDEPWGWATYHYGRWDFHPQLGWYWVPQTQWAPAWVSWHEGGGYVGWAPLHPSARVSGGGAVTVNVALIAPRAFVFVEPRQFLQPVRPSTVVVNNTTIINNTVNITNVKVVNQTVINEGPRTTVIEQASGRPVQPIAVRELRQKEEAPVIARRSTVPVALPKPLPAPVRTAVVPAENKFQAAKPTPGVAPALQPQPHKSTGELLKKLHTDSQPPPQPSPPTAQQPPPKAVIELPGKSQLDAERRAREAAQKPQGSSPRNTLQLQKKPPTVQPPPPPVEEKPPGVAPRPGNDKKAAKKNAKDAKDAEDKNRGKKPELPPVEKPPEPSSESRF